MKISRRYFLLASASAVAISSSIAGGVAEAAVSVGTGEDNKALLLRMVRVMFPHSSIGDAPYERTCDAIRTAAGKTVGQALMFSEGMQDLKAAEFAKMNGVDALAHLKSIESTPFFQLVRGTSVVSFYSDHEVWEILGYEGPSYDQGGYINRGFNDLDWLPDPRIVEL